MTHYVMTNEKKFSINKSKILWISWGSASLISSRSPFPNFRGLDADKKLTAWLYYLKDAGSIFMTANTLGINQSTVCEVVLEVCIAATKYIGPKHLHLPKTVEEMKLKVSQLKVKSGMSQAFGAIDETRIPIQRPMENWQDFFNHKVFFQFQFKPRLITWHKNIF